MEIVLLGGPVSLACDGSSVLGTGRVGFGGNDSSCFTGCSLFTFGLLSNLPGNSSRKTLAFNFLALTVNMFLTTSSLMLLSLT